MRAVRATITATGGFAVLLRARALSGGPEIAAVFNAARDREYNTIATSCRDAADRIEAMIAVGDFRYEQLSDSEAALKRLDTRYHAVVRRDLLGAARAAGAMAALNGYRSLLDQYARYLYARENPP
jgi:ChrB-like protein